MHMNLRFLLSSLALDLLKFFLSKTDFESSQLELKDDAQINNKFFGFLTDFHR